MKLHIHILTSTSVKIVVIAYSCFRLDVRERPVLIEFTGLNLDARNIIHCHLISVRTISSCWQGCTVMPGHSMMRPQMETFSALLALCAGNSPVTGEFEFSSQRPVTRSFDIFVDLRLKKRLNKQSRHRWLGTPSRALWRHSNVLRRVRGKLQPQWWSHMYTNPALLEGSIKIEGARKHCDRYSYIS